MGEPPLSEGLLAAQGITKPCELKPKKTLLVFPRSLTLRAYVEMWNTGPFVKYFANSMAISLSTFVGLQRHFVQGLTVEAV